MSNQTTIKNIKQAMNIIRKDYGYLLKGINKHTVILAKLSNSLQNNDFNDASGIVVDLWESCQQANK